MATFKNVAIRLATIAAGSITLSGMLLAGPISALAYYGAVPNPTLPSNYACSGRFDPNCIIETTNYLVGQSYSNQYSQYSSPYATNYGSNYNYGTSYNSYNPYSSSYYTPNYSNSYSSYNPYSTSYNYTQPYQYSVPSYNYSYVSPTYQQSSYNYNYQYQYSYQNAQPVQSPYYNYSYSY
jgi:hypothetical protein